MSIWGIGILVRLMTKVKLVGSVESTTELNYGKVCSKITLETDLLGTSMEQVTTTIYRFFLPDALFLAEATFLALAAAPQIF